VLFEQTRYARLLYFLAHRHGEDGVRSHGKMASCAIARRCVQKSNSPLPTFTICKCPKIFSLQAGYDHSRMITPAVVCHYLTNWGRMHLNILIHINVPDTQAR